MVQVEFYGIPRQRAGTASIEIESNHRRLGDVLSELGRRLPSWAAACLEGEQLRSGFIVNIDGEQFVTDPDTPLTTDSCVLIMTADAGG